MISGGTAWRITRRGLTFAIGKTSEVESMPRGAGPTPSLGAALYQAGVSVLPGIEKHPSPDAL